jgi:gamma-glutamylaminecyclotransferase
LTTGSKDEVTGRRLVFVYGSLKEGYGNHRLLQASTLVHHATLPYGHRMFSLGGFPGVVEADLSSGYPIHGEVYEVTERTLFESLDYLEGYDKGTDTGMYLRRPVMVELDNGELEAVETYIYNSQTAEDMEADDYPEIVDGSW